jgi:hypothetical protein
MDGGRAKKACRSAGSRDTREDGGHRALRRRARPGANVGSDGLHRQADLFRVAVFLSRRCLWLLGLWTRKGKQGWVHGVFTPPGIHMTSHCSHPLATPDHSCVWLQYLARNFLYNGLAPCSHAMESCHAHAHRWGRDGLYRLCATRPAATSHVDAISALSSVAHSRIMELVFKARHGGGNRRRRTACTARVAARTAVIPIRRHSHEPRPAL